MLKVLNSQLILYKKCPKCGKEELIIGELKHSGSILFVPDDQKKMIINKASGVKADACKNCGYLFNFYLKDLDNL